MIWTVIAINHETKVAEATVFNLSHDGPAAEKSAAGELPGKTIVAMVKGSHGLSTYLPTTTFSLKG